MTNFYLVKSTNMRFGDQWAYVLPSEHETYGEPRRCPVCGGPISKRMWLPPHQIELSSATPRKWPDVLWGSVSPFMVSARFRQLWEASGLGGIERFHPPAEVIKLGRRRHDLPPDLPTYHAVDIHWNGANLDDSGSEVVRRNDHCPYHRGAFVRLERLLIEEPTWDGSHVFVARGLTGQVVATQEFTDFCAQHHMTNVLLLHAETMAYDEKRMPAWQPAEQPG